MQLHKLGLTVATAATGALLTASAWAAEPIKIGFIDPLSGPFSVVGENGLREWRFAADTFVNSKGGILGGRMIEVVGFDNKISQIGRAHV